VSMGKAGGAVDNSIAELDVTEGLSDAVGATMVEDSPLGAEIATTLLSALDSGFVDSAVVAEDASEVAAALDEETAVSAEDVGTEGVGTEAG
jgi:hypothetical protein